MQSKFETALKNTLNDEATLTENGANAFKTSGHDLLDMNFAVSALRSASADQVVERFTKAFAENPLLAVKWLFFARDVREGLGERRIFRICFAWLANVRPELVKKLIPLVNEYGRFDDILNSGLEGELWDAVVDFVSSKLAQDMNSEHPSLLAKWLPSINTSSMKTRALAKKLVKALGMTDRQYRKTLSALRKKLDVVEVNASAKNWGAINYNAVPSLANLKYKNAFLRNDEDRRRKWLAALEKHDGTAKINSSASFPYDIVHAYSTIRGWMPATKPYDTALEEMWKALPNYASGIDAGSTIAVCDTSGSMCSPISSSTTALEAAISLSLYFAERLESVFKNKLISFSERPKFIDTSACASLKEKIDLVYANSEVANTDLKKTFMLILDTAVRNNLKQEEIPSNILVLSDMQFDQGVESYREYNASNCALMAEIAAEFAKHGYTLPRLVYWNLCSRNYDTIPMQQNANGLVLVSGFSPTIAKMVFSEKLDPYDALVDALSVERYKPIEEAFNSTAA